MDLIVTRWIVQSDEFPEVFNTRDFSEVTRPLHLFHNNGDATFSNVSTLLGDVDVSPSNVHGAGFQPRFFDYDNDGDSDIIIVNDFGEEHQPSVLWRNDGPSLYNTWLFVDVSESTNVDVEIFAMGVAIGDYDNDEDFDLYITNMGDNVLLQNSGQHYTNTADFAGVAAGKLKSETIVSDMEEKFGGLVGMGITNLTQSEMEHLQEYAGEIPIMMGTPNLTQSEMEQLQEHAGEIPIAWGTIFFDYDNDGFLDLYVVRGFMTDLMPIEKNQPNVLFRNNGNSTFSDVSATSGIDDSGYGRGVAYGDFNNDGCLDIFVANIDQIGKLFLNNCDGENNYLIIKTVGTSSNKDGIGTKIKVVTDSGTFTREVTSGGSHMSQNSLSVHFGLGESKHISLIQITWPSGNIQELENTTSNQIITVVEP